MVMEKDGGSDLRATWKTSQLCHYLQIDAQCCRAAIWPHQWEIRKLQAQCTGNRYQKHKLESPATEQQKVTRMFSLL